MYDVFFSFFYHNFITASSPPVPTEDPFLSKFYHSIVYCIKPSGAYRDSVLFAPFLAVAFLKAPSSSIKMSLIPPSKANTDSQLLSRPVRPTIVLVHAGWHGPETYSLVVPGLEKAGYSITAVTLPSAGQTPAVPDLSEDVKIIHNTVTSNLRIGKDVVLVMHSFGSISGCEALKGVAEELANDHAHQPPGVKVGKVMKLAFISAKLVPEGEAVWESSRDRPPGFQRVVRPFIS